jgi:hypothetical protein
VGGCATLAKTLHRDRKHRNQFFQLQRDSFSIAATVELFPFCPKSFNSQHPPEIFDPLSPAPTSECVGIPTGLCTPGKIGYSLFPNGAGHALHLTMLELSSLRATVSISDMLKRLQ